MKTIFKSICGLLLISTLQINAKTNLFDKTELVNNMTKSENVAQLINNRVNTAFLGMAYDVLPIEYQSDKALLKDKTEILILKSNESLKQVELEFPEYASLNNTEKSDILKQILQSDRFVGTAAAKMKCAGVALLAAVGCDYFTPTVYQGYVFLGCFAAGLFADIAAVITDPAALEILYYSIRLEIRSCARIASRTYLEGVSTNCWTGFTAALVLCCFV